MIAGIALTQSPEACQIAHIDPKGNEAAIWTGLPHLFAPAATSIEAITGLAQDLVDEMERRGLLLAGRAARSITSYNTMMLREGGEPLPWLVVVIDEFVDLITQTGLQSALAKSFTRLANKANGFGITLIFAATNPRGDVVDGLLRANCPIRIAYSVPDKAISRAILGKGGAEAIAPEQKGRQIARLVDGREHLIQGYFLDDAQLQRVSAALCHREQTQPQNASVLSELELALIDTAERELDGVFAIGKLFAKHGAVISKVKIADLANRWERKGWLTAHNGGAMGRRLTPQLLEVRNRVRAAECNRAPRWDKVSTSTLHNQSLPFATRREATVQR